jgi:hypothetical protein
VEKVDPIFRANSVFFQKNFPKKTTAQNGEKSAHLVTLAGPF